MADEDTEATPSEAEETPAPDQSAAEGAAAEKPAAEAGEPAAEAAEEPAAEKPAEKPKTDDAPTETPATDAPKAETPADGPAAAPEAEPAEPSVVDAGPAAWPNDKEKYGYIWGTGRRKSSTARVRIRPGSGVFIVNDRPYEQYFKSDRERNLATAVLATTKRAEHYDVFVRANGGGSTGQAGAVLLGIARALKTAEPMLEPVLREHGHLTRDSRQKERKKYGRRGARRSFQFSKR